MTGEFKDKVVVVGGGSRGIGKGIAKAFAREGAQLVIASSRPEHLETASGEIVAAGGLKPETVSADLRTLEGAQAVLERVTSRFGRCNVLVNSQGAAKGGLFVDQPDDQWIDGFALKFFGCVRMCRLFWPMLKQAQGHVVNISGAAGKIPDPDALVIGSINGAMGTFAKGLSRLGLRDGVNVNLIMPGLTRTERLTDLVKARAETSGRAFDDIMADMLKATGARRIGEVDDTAELALFLCSEKARHIQGAAIPVEGGMIPATY